MSPERVRVINNHKIEEYYWAGKLVVYIDNVLSSGESFDEACLRLSGDS